MKKILVLACSLAVILSLAACGKNTEVEAVTEAAETVKETVETESSVAEESEEPTVYTESIPLGGNCGDLPIDGKAYGSYVEIEPAGAFAAEDFVETHVYYDAESDTPYIATYRWNKNGLSLEELVKEESETWSDGYYQMVDSSDWGYGPGGKAGYICYSYEDEEGNFDFSELEIFEDGDDFVEIDYTAKAEEVQLGDSDMYIYIPAGYDDITTADYKSHGAILYANYDESYYFPTIYIDKSELSYEYMEWYWSGMYPDGIPYTKEQYQKDYIENATNLEYWDEEKNAEFYACFGGEMTYSYSTTKEGVECFLYGVDFDSTKTRDTDILFMRNNECYEIWTETEYIDCMPYIGTSIINSLHRKSGTLDISLGGNCGEFVMEGIAYGDNYKEVPAEGCFKDDESYEIHVYEDQAADTPYVAVYRAEKKGRTLESMAETGMGFFNAIYYKMASTEGYDYIPGDEMLYICGHYEIDGQFCYLDVITFEDGDDFVTICWVNKSKEIPLADSGKYLWVPAGYTSYMNPDEAAHGASFFGVYDESYWIPTIWIGKNDISYEYIEWSWASAYADGLPFTKEEYEAVQQKLPESIMDNKGEYDEYYKLFGYELKYVNEYKIDGAICEQAVIESEESGCLENHIVINVNGTYYDMWTTMNLTDDAPYIGKTLIDSIH